MGDWGPGSVFHRGSGSTPGKLAQSNPSEAKYSCFLPKRNSQRALSLDIEWPTPPSLTKTFPVLVLKSKLFNLWESGKLQLPSLEEWTRGELLYSEENEESPRLPKAHNSKHNILDIRHLAPLSLENLVFIYCTQNPSFRLLLARWLQISSFS